MFVRNLSLFVTFTSMGRASHIGANRSSDRLLVASAGKPFFIKLSTCRAAVLFVINCIT